ncbi:MAG TPA: hypothetical protein VM122_08095 [Usitatibacter sp.]|nr:hypothetical protein [Usitatibacter sp.]
MQRTLAALVLAALAATPALASNEEHVILLDHRHLAANDAQADVWKRWADDYSREMRASMGTMFAGRVGSAKLVKGAPYSAEVVTENNQPLADGNVITRRTSGAVYRDGAGRTRQESGGDGRERVVYITDPVESKTYVLTPGAKRAIVTSHMAHPIVNEKEIAKEVKREIKNRQVVRVNATEIRIEDGKVFVDGEEVAGGTVNLRAKSGKEVRVEGGKVFIDGKEIARADGGSNVTRSTTSVSPDGTRREEVRVRVVRSGDDEHMPVPPLPPMPPIPPGAVVPLPPLPPMPGIQTMRFESTAKLGKGITTNLGTKDFDGVKAEGRATTWTIPAGEIGNRSAINVVSESWYSPELQVTVYSRNADPRTGETIYRLAGIKRGEPGAELFKVPEEYKLRDRTAK